MVCTDTKLHAEIIKLLFWNFHWGHYVSVSHLDSVKEEMGKMFERQNGKTNKLKKEKIFQEFLITT